MKVQPHEDIKKRFKFNSSLLLSLQHPDLESNHVPSEPLATAPLTEVKEIFTG